MAQVFAIVTIVTIVTIVCLPAAIRPSIVAFLAMGDISDEHRRVAMAAGRDACANIEAACQTKCEATIRPACCDNSTLKLAIGASSKKQIAVLAVASHGICAKKELRIQPNGGMDGSLSRTKTLT